MSIELKAEEKSFYPQASQEALFARRIVAFWKEGDRSLAKMQLQEFLRQYPSSEFADKFLNMLGDLYLSEKSFEEALKTYNAIKNLELIAVVRVKRLECLYHLKEFAIIRRELQPLLSMEASFRDLEDELKAFFLAEALREQAKECDNPEESQQIFQSAQYYYDKIQSPQYRLRAKEAMAILYREMGDYQKAANIYLTLAESLPKKTEDCLFLAANLLASQNPSQAVQIFERLQDMKGKRFYEATLSKVLILFDLGDYRKIIESNVFNSQEASQEQSLLLQFLVGRSYFALNYFKEAIECLYPVLNNTKMLFNGKNETTDNLNDRILLLTLISCAYHVNDMVLLEDCAKRYEMNFGQDKEMAKVLYLKAVAYNHHNRIKEAKECLEEIMISYPFFERMDSVAYESGLILFQEGRWKESRAYFLDYIDRYPQSGYSQFVWRMIIQATQKQIETTKALQEPTEVLNRQLISDLQKATSENVCLSKDQKTQFLFILSKVYYEEGLFDEALVGLTSYMQEEVSDQNLGQGYLLMALCYQNGFHDNQKFIECAEKALNLKTSFSEKNHLRLNLFNSYLQILNKNVKEPLIIDKAAEHLHSVFESEKKLIKDEHLRWLGSYFYQKVKQGQNEYFIEPLKDRLKQQSAEKGIIVYRELLKRYLDTEGKEKGTLQREGWDVIKLAHLLGWTNKIHEQSALIESHLARKEAFSEAIKAQLFYLFGHIKQLTGEIKEAENLFSSILTTRGNKDPYLESSVKLHLARLRFEGLLPDEKHLENPTVVELLKDLKDLQIRKELMREPLHLEASIDYAMFRAKIGPQEEFDEQFLFYLMKLKEDFTSRDDVCAKDYDVCRREHPEKDVIYQAYMMLVDAHIARLEAYLAKKQGKMLDVEWKLEASKTIYKSLIKGKFAVSKYIADQAKSGLLDLEE